MRLGLITDVHERVEHLRSALDRFVALGVDRIVVIGDVYRTGDHIEETCRLLLDAGAVGVRGNHDVGPRPDLLDGPLSHPSPVVRDYMSGLHAWLEIAGCRFAHVEPWLNPDDVADLWYTGGPPTEPGDVERILAAMTIRLAFGGHYHDWILVSESGIVSWNANHPIDLHEGRWFVVVGALCEGRFAVLDTESWLLSPLHVNDDNPALHG